MNKTIKILTTAAALGASALFTRAQPAPKVVTVNMAKLLDGYYKSVEQTAKLKADEQKAQQDLDALNKDGNALVEQYKQTLDQAKNPMLTADARAKAESDSQSMLEQIQRKQQDRQQFIYNVQNSFRERINNFRTLFLEEISKVVVQTAQQHGATLVLDTSGPSLLGVSAVLYADPGYDITDEVLAVINKGHPVPVPEAAPAAGSAPAAAAPASTDNTPKITLPSSLSSGAGK